MATWKQDYTGHLKSESVPVTHKGAVIGHATMALTDADHFHATTNEQGGLTFRGRTHSVSAHYHWDGRAWKRRSWHVGDHWDGARLVPAPRTYAAAMLAALDAAVVENEPPAVARAAAGRAEREAAARYLRDARLQVARIVDVVERAESMIARGETPPRFYGTELETIADKWCQRLAGEKS